MRETITHSCPVVVHEWKQRLKAFQTVQFYNVQFQTVLAYENVYNAN